MDSRAVVESPELSPMTPAVPALCTDMEGDHEKMVGC